MLQINFITVVLLVVQTGKKLIDFGKGDRCLLPTNDPLWTEPRNLKMQTRNSEKNRPLLHLTFTTVKRLLEEK